MQIQVKDTKEIYFNKKDSFTSKPEIRKVLATEGKLILIKRIGEACGNFWLNHDNKTYSIHSTDEGDHQYKALIKPTIISQTEPIESLDNVLVDNKFITTTKSWEFDYACRFPKEKRPRYKILTLPEHFSPQHLQDIVDGKLKEGDKVLVECENDTYDDTPLTTKPCTVIKFDSSNHITLYQENKSELYLFYEWYSEANAASRADVLNKLQKRLNLPIEQYPKL